MRAVILTAEGKGFNAGIDIKEMQSVEGFEHLLGSGAACFAAFEAIYQCPVPTIAAVNDFCMGLGVGLVGSCDIIVASTKARFGLPEVDNGALGCASHLAKLVPPMKLRQMVLTCEPVTAAQLYEWGTRLPALRARRAAWPRPRAAAAKIVTKRPRVVRAAKTALNLHRHLRPADATTGSSRASPTSSTSTATATRRATRSSPARAPSPRTPTADGPPRRQGRDRHRRGAGHGRSHRRARSWHEGARVVLVDKRDDLGADARRPSSATAARLRVGRRHRRGRLGTARRHARSSASAASTCCVNNAGIIRVQPLLETDLELFRKVARHQPGVGVPRHPGGRAR